MIYAASLGSPLKKAYGDKCYVTSVTTITENMKLDSSVSGMDVCVFGPKDVVGINRTKVQAAANGKHPSVCIIYVYTKDKEAAMLDVPFKKQIKKIDADSMRDCVDEYIDAHTVGVKKAPTSRDSRVSKPITSKPVDHALASGGIKGKLLRNTAGSTTKMSDKKSSDELLFDPALELYYYLDPIGQMIYCDKDTRRSLSRAEVQEQKEIIAQRVSEETATAEAEEEDIEEEDIPVKLPVRGGLEEESATPVEPIKPVNPVTQTTPTESVDDRTARTFEKNLESISDFHDWGLLKEALSKDVVVRQLLEENSTFQGVVQMLSVMDTEIKTIYRDAGLTAEQKFEKMLEIGGKRSTLMATHNDIVSRKVIDIMEAVTISARRTVEELLAEHRQAIEQITVADKNIMDETELNRLIEKRTNAVVELLTVTKSIVQLYQAMDLEVNDIILTLDKNLPSDNEFINNMVGSAAQILTPTNTKSLAFTLMKALQSKREILTLLQGQVDSVIDAVHNLLQKDEAIIEYQQHMIKVLKAHRVEDVVVLDSVLKNILHIYVGTEGTGRTATTLTWAGCQSRRRNTLLIDLTGNNKLRDYGVEPVMLDDFLRERIDRQLCVVEGVIDDVEERVEFVHELKTRLDYYAYIDVVLDVDQMDFVNMLAEEALTINYITDCTNDSLEDIETCYASTEVENVARKLLLIDPPIDVLKLANKVGADVTMIKCVTIPNLRKIKMCSVTGEAPYEYREVRSVFEEAFR